MMLTPKFLGILKKREMFQEIEVQKLRERWCAYNEKKLFIPNTSIQFSWGALSKFLTRILVHFYHQTCVGKIQPFSITKKPDFSVQVPWVGPWLACILDEKMWVKWMIFFSGWENKLHLIWEKNPRVYFLFILIFYLLRSSCNLKKSEFCDCFLFRVVKKLSAFTSLSQKKLQGMELVGVEVDGSWSLSWGQWKLISWLPGFVRVHQQLAMWEVPGWVFDIMRFLDAPHH